ncbi:MAG TPA: GH3 auxin-responsive promoter family protein, partial [Bacteroidia bacterium]|nr:GH3 auxin-responsive promoter family protein [Bacteroidia bacterium]
FAHHWFLGVNGNLDREKAKSLLDEKLKELNDDYAVERISALKELIIDTVPAGMFYTYMSNNGRLGGQNKFPRVLKSTQLQEWKEYVSKR